VLYDVLIEASPLRPASSVLVMLCYAMLQLGLLGVNAVLYTLCNIQRVFAQPRPYSRRIAPPPQFVLLTLLT